MSRYESLLIGVDRPFEQVAARIGEIFGAEPESVANLGDEPEWFVQLDDGVTSWLHVNDYVGEKRFEVDVASYDYDLQLRRRSPRGEPRDEAAQEAAARRTYETLIAETDWRVALFFDDLQEFVISRESVGSAV